MTTGALTGLAAFLSGVGSVLGALWTIRRARRREREICEQRVTDLHDAYSEGFDVGLRMDRRR